MKRQVTTFGCNDHCALGRETRDDDCCCFPMYVDLGRIVIAQVSAGDSHTAVLSRYGQVFIFGAFRVYGHSFVSFVSFSVCQGGHGGLVPPMAA